MPSHEQLSRQSFQVTHDNPQFFYNFIKSQERFITNPTPEQLGDWLQSGSAVWDDVQFQNLAVHETLSTTELDGEIFTLEHTSLTIDRVRGVLVPRISTTIVRGDMKFNQLPFYTLETVDSIVENLNFSGVPSSASFSGISSHVVVNEGTPGFLRVNLGSPGFISYSLLEDWYTSTSRGKWLVESSEKRLYKGVKRVDFCAELPIERDVSFKESMKNFARNYQLLLTAMYEAESKNPPPVTIHFKAPSALTTRLNLDF